MSVNTLTIISTLAMLMASVFGGPTVRVFSGCSGPVYFASVHPGATADMQILPTNGYSETISEPDSGVSIKLAPNVTASVTQFEFSWSDGLLYYDISNIDGNPFWEQGASLIPSGLNVSGYPTCVNVECPAGEVYCHAAYNEPDDIRTMVCPASVQLDMVVCPGAGNRRTARRGHQHPHVPHSIYMARSAF